METLEKIQLLNKINSLIKELVLLEAAGCKEVNINYIKSQLAELKFQL